jgi:hypothetical protein
VSILRPKRSAVARKNGLPRLQNGDDNAAIGPQGLHLMGTYDSVVAFGQSKALVVWLPSIARDGMRYQYRIVFLCTLFIA